MTDRWTKSNKAVYNIGYHLIWCPKYRRKILVNKIADRLQILLHEIANSIDCKIQSLEIMPDYVHIFIKCSPIHSPHFILQQLKGKTSNILRKEFPDLKSKLPCLWTRSYLAESVGCIFEETIVKYIENQKNQ